MHALLAQVGSSAGPNGWIVVIALGMLVSLGIGVITLSRLISGKSGERQIEPTNLAALSAQIGCVAKELSGINRELGEVRAIGERTEEAVGELTKKQHDDMSGAHKRIDQIDREVAAQGRQIDSIEKRCPNCA
jgi:chromosome segregation ATPase